jgi:hypothetical protein
MNDNAAKPKSEPNKSVRLYTLIKDYAQRKYKCDDNQVMKLYIGTKRAAEITDNAALIAYVDGKMNPEQPKPESKPQTIDEVTFVKDSLGEAASVEKSRGKIKVTIKDSRDEEDLRSKMQEIGYSYSTKRGLSYFFIKN